VDLHLGQNGPAVRLVSNTTLSLDRLTYEARGGETVIDTQMDVRTGAILGNARKLAEASRYEVKTLIGVAGIRGTEYFLSAAGVLHVLSGTVDLAVVVAAPDGQVAGNIVTVGAGQSFIPPANLNSATISSLISNPTLPEVTAEILGLMPSVAPEAVSAPLIQDMNRDVQLNNPKVELISN
jgi:hypothetical protein